MTLVSQTTAPTPNLHAEAPTTKIHKLHDIKECKLTRHTGQSTTTVAATRGSRMKQNGAKPRTLNRNPQGGPVTSAKPRMST